MGHVRLGRLPLSVRWQGVVGLLRSSPEAPTIARATLAAAEARLRRLRGDPALGYCFWLLSRLAIASRDPDFEAALEQIGLEWPRTDSALAFVSLVSERVRMEVVRHPESGHFGELASLAFRRTLLETVGQHGRSLFGSSRDDLQRAFREHSTPNRFGDLTQRFFADYVARTLRFFIERELSNSVGADYALATVADRARFTEALDVYTRQSARIVQDFAHDWYSKHRWESGGQINPDEAQAFVAVALRKMRAELMRPER